MNKWGTHLRLLNAEKIVSASDTFFQYLSGSVVTHIWDRDLTQTLRDQIARLVFTIGNLLPVHRHAFSKGPTWSNMFLSFSCSCFWLFVTEQITNIFTFQYILNYCFLLVNSHDITHSLRTIRVHYEFRTFRLLCTIFRSTKVSGFYTHRPNKIVPSHTQQNEKYTRKILVTHLCLGAHICIRNMS